MQSVNPQRFGICEGNEIDQTLAKGNSTFHMRRVLVPIDFSAYSISALGCATVLAEKFGAAIVLLHVIEPGIVPSGLGYAPIVTETVGEHFREHAQVRLRALAAKCPKQVPVEVEICIGCPYREIVSASARLRADLIIIATRGLSLSASQGMGSTVERVARQAPCTVLVLREPPPESATSHPRNLH
ncbi:MAG: universal stress protein [Verrucomicrobiae bacterium]|nr:universal stress protein [Verrucomicrobiae bacterium]